MGVSRRTAGHLRGRGHDVGHLAEVGRQRGTDEQVMASAAGEGRAVVTFDLDFVRLLALARAGLPSVVLIRLEQFTTDEVNYRMDRVLADYGAELAAGAVVVVEPGRERVRALP